MKSNTGKYDIRYLLKVGLVFRTESDIFLCGVYIWGEDSPAHNVINVDLFDCVQEDINNFESKGSVFIVGDWNARVGSRADYIICDRNVSDLDYCDYIPDSYLKRCSMDRVCNTQGNKLLDLCRSTLYRIVNGRLGSDHSVGDYTFASQQGESVIDYLIAKEQDFSKIQTFEIGEFNEWSDHEHIAFSLKCRTVKSGTNTNERTYYKWNDAKRNEFRSLLISKLPELNHVTDNLTAENRESINLAVNSFVQVIQEAANPVFRKTTCANHIGRFSNTLNKPAEWFDGECFEAKRVYMNSLKIFNECRTAENRQASCALKHTYKQLIKRKRSLFELKKVKTIESLRHSKPKDFWRLFTKKKSQSNTSLTIDDFHKFFSKLSSDIEQAKDQEAETFCTDFRHDGDACRFPELDRRISISEVNCAINMLKRNKAAGSDLLVNEYFVEANDIIASHLVDLFNAILDSGYFPEKWTEGIIIPVFKKGNPDDANNYRGITLVSCLSKLFTGILDKRIIDWAEENNVISDSQFGFRRGRSTTDAIFLLQSLIQKVLSQKGRLYCAFVDLQKAFDSVYLNGLWFKLYKLGIDGKLLRVIRDMYDKVKSCVRHCNSFSEFFECSIGL